MTGAVTREKQTPPWQELGVTKEINREKYKGMKTDTPTIAKIAGMSGGIALVIAKTAPYGGPEGLKNKVMFGLGCVTASLLLYDLIARNLHDIKQDVKIINAERGVRNA